MNGRFQAVAGLLMALLVGSSAHGSGADARPADGQVRWDPLPLNSQDGKIGFTLLPPTLTGLDFTNTLSEAASASNRVLENGSGVALGDFDQDGRCDIFLCSLTGKSALYRNRGGWRFENVTAATGLAGIQRACRGAVLADINGDRWPDLLVSTLQDGVLCFINDGRGAFINHTERAGTETGPGSTTLAFADVDGNGTVDLYVANYRADDIRDRPRIDIRRVNGRIEVAPWLQGRLMLTPGGIREFGEPDVLLLNDGTGRFTRVNWTQGTFLDEDGNPLQAPPQDWGLTASFRDLNGDGLPDLYVCNDYWTPDRIWINQGHGRFKSIDPVAIRHTSENSMGVDFADLDRDGHVDFLVLDMLSRHPAMRKRQVLAQTKMGPGDAALARWPQIMRNTLFHNRGDGTFAELADFAGLFASDWSWQPVFVDVDLDGFDDVIISAGHRRDVQDLDATARIRSLQRPWPRDMDAKTLQAAFTHQMLEHARLYPTLEMPVIAFRNLGNLQFKEVTEDWGTADLAVHQGIAFGDFDSDGDLDFVTNNLDARCGVYRNDTTAPRIAVRLRGAAPNTEGIGARVSLLGGPVPEQTAEMAAGGRYLSGFEPLLVFAGGGRRTMTLRVRWRSGRETVIEGVEPNRRYEVRETPEAEGRGPKAEG